MFGVQVVTREEQLRTAPEGKAQQLSAITPAASLIRDDNKGICQDCREAGALVAHAEKGGGADQLKGGCQN